MEETEVQRVASADALEKARRRVRFTAEDAANALGISVGALGDYEAGLRTPSEELVDAMARLYGVEPGRLDGREWVQRIPPRYDAEESVLWFGWHGIHIREKDNEQIIRSVAAALRSMRTPSDQSPVYLRSAELPMLASLLDLQDESLPDLFMRYLRLSPSDSLATVNHMVVVSSVDS